jgi:hypothetical protein
MTQNYIDSSLHTSLLGCLCISREIAEGGRMPVIDPTSVEGSVVKSVVGSPLLTYLLHGAESFFRS